MKHTSKLATMIECRHVGKVLQTYLDGHTDEATTQRVARHLEACRRCGFEVSTYRELSASLRRRGGTLDEIALARLRTFANSMVLDPPAPRPEGA